MELQKQVTSLELSKKLKELGFKQESLFYYGRKDGTLFATTGIGETVFGYTTLNAEGPGGNPYWFDFSELEETDEDWISAYTVAELGEMLPSQWNGFVLRCEKQTNANSQPCWYIAYWEVGYEDETRGETFNEESEADARAKMLIYLKKNNLI